MNIRDLSKALHRLQNGFHLPDEFDQLICLSEYPTPSARAKVLWELLERHVQQALKSCQAGHPRNSLTDLQNAFATQNTEWQVWCVVYWRYFHPVHTLKLREIALKANTPIEYLRQRLSRGLRQLLERLEEEEMRSRRQHFQSRQITFARRHLTYRLTDDQRRCVGDQELFTPGTLSIIEGMPGIGKSSIALHLCDTLEKTQSVIWIEAQREYLDRYGQIHSLPEAPHTAAAIIQQIYHSMGLFQHTDLTHQLSAIESYLTLSLIVINRVDALGQDECNTLMGYLDRLTNHSIMLTSRYALQHGHGKVVCAPELELHQSSQVLQYAQRSASTTKHKHNSLSEAALKQFHEKVGGVPLALMVLGTHLSQVPAKHALEQLQAGEPPFDSLYEYLFRRTWQQLSENGRELLLYLASGERSWFSEQSLRARDLGKAAVQATAEVNRHHLIEIDIKHERRLVRLKPILHTGLKSRIYEKW
ncbi:MAG: NB-ARC domain-containing protein [Aggregatilineales bacterium]